MSARYAAVVCAIAAAMLTLFAVAELAGVAPLTDPSGWLEQREGAVALSLGLLLVDVVAPVASSAVMTANGALFGFVGGTLLSLAGSVGASALAFALGRRGGPALDRVVPRADRARADALLARWGALAVLVTRPVPIAAETVALLAGTSALRWPRFVAAATLGSLPPALLYAAAGALVIDHAAGVLVLGCVVALAVLAWLARLGR